MHFEAALNVVWLALGLIALSAALRRAFNVRRNGYRAQVWLKIGAVGLLVAALLFPYFSATDDIVRIEHLNAQQSRNHAPERDHSKKTNTSSLIRLYETMDTPLVSPVAVFVFTFFFVSLVFTRLFSFIGHQTAQASGRSPPLAA